MTTRGLWAGRTLALLGVLLVALSLRTPVAALSPILDRIGAEMTLDAVVLALIGAAPPLAFAASGFVAPALARRIGLEQALLLALAAMSLGHLVRAVAPESLALTLGTVLTLLGVGLGNVLLPAIVRRYFPDRIGLITSLYATLLSVSTALPPLIAVPVADSAGWRVSLAVWMLVSLMAAVPWVAVLLEKRPRLVAGATGGASDEVADAVTGAVPVVVHPPATGRLGVRMLRSPTAWALAVIFGSSSLSAYACFAWLPTMLVEHAGASDVTAGALLALYAFMGFPAGIIVPIVAARFPRGAALMVVLGAAFFALGYLGLLLAPAAATAVWVASAGLGPLLFPLALVLINLRSASPASTVALSGFVQTIGYIVGAVGPFVVGLLHDASGGWTVPLVFLLVVMTVILPAAAVLARNRVVDSEL